MDHYGIAKADWIGLSMGAMTGMGLAIHHPDRFAAIAPICGGGDPADAPQLAKTPIWAFHGDADRTVKKEQSRSMVAAISIWK